MYQWSMEYFLTLFVNRLDKAQKSLNLEIRLALLITDITDSIFQSICHGLFAQHKIFLAFQLATKIQLEEGSIAAFELDSFIRSPTMPLNYNIRIAPLSEYQSFFLETLCQHNLSMERLLQLLMQDSSSLDAFLQSADPYNHKMSFQLSPWAKLLLIRVKI